MCVQDLGPGCPLHTLNESMLLLCQPFLGYFGLGFLLNFNTYILLIEFLKIPYRFEKIRSGVIFFQFLRGDFNFIRELVRISMPYRK
jgi:hypothetical protein